MSVVGEMGIINNIDELIDTYFSDHGHQFMAQSLSLIHISGRAHVDLFRTGLIEEVHRFPELGAPDDGIVHKQQLFPLNQLGNGDQMCIRDRILAVSDDALAAKLDAQRSEMAEQIAAKEAKLQVELAH